MQFMEQGQKSQVANHPGIQNEKAITVATSCMPLIAKLMVVCYSAYATAAVLNLQANTSETTSSWAVRDLKPISRMSTCLEKMTILIFWEVNQFL